MNEECRSFFDASYRSAGLGAQRRYPNEELMRFMGRNFFSVPRSERKHIKLLEVGCGSGANLWALAREGFDVYGSDLSSEAIHLSRGMLESFDCTAHLEAGDMINLAYEEDFFDAVLDVFASYCLTEEHFAKFLNGVARVLKPGGIYFSYTPSKNSDVFKQTPASEKIDASTLNGIHRPSAPFYGNDYPFRFTGREEYARLLAAAGNGALSVTYNETVGRTYRDGKEYFEFVVVEAVKGSRNVAR